MRQSPPPPGSVALIYGRHSSDQQNPLSADDQNRNNAQYCERQSWPVGGRFKDEAITGRSTAKRHGYYSLMAAAEAGPCDVIVMEDLSRLGRDAAELHIAARKLREANVVICTPSGGVMSPLELAIRAQMAEEYSADLALRVKRGHASAARKGRVIGGIAYGYRLVAPGQGADDGAMSERPIEELREVDLHQARIIIRIFEDYIAGVSTHAICAALNQEGEPGPGGKLWRPRSITGDKHLMTGLLRNPLYIGRLVYGKSNSRLISSTGKVVVTPGPSSDQIVADVPHLRIVSDELWEAAQARLEALSAAIPNRSRHATYLTSGLVFCGSCGKTFSIVGVNLGCTGRHFGTGCTNRRRVAREDIERAVLQEWPEKLFNPPILDLYLEEYRRELEKATADYATRGASLETRRQELDRQIANVLAQVRAGASGYAAEVLNEQLNELGAQRKQLDREFRKPPPESQMSFETDAVIERLQVLLSDLSAALAGPERDAARARDIVRSIIQRITISPLETDDKPDARGAGPVRVTVEGSLTALLGHASVDRVIQRRGSGSATLDLPTVTFRYYVDVTKKNSATVEGLYSDVAVFSRLLDDAYIPVGTSALMDALRDPGDDPSPAELHIIDLRARRAIAHLNNAGAIRSVRLADAAGWVWADLAISDEQLRERARQPRQPAAPIGIVRMGAPEAFVVVVSQPNPAVEPAAS